MRDFLLRLASIARHAFRPFGNRSRDAAMDDEMRYHLERETAERIQAGMSPLEARRTAMRDFGGLEAHKEEGRDVRRVRLLDDTARDTAYAVRVLRRSPGFAAAVVLTFALGIGCTSSIFSLVYGILLRPLPYADPAQLVTLWERDDAHNAGPNVSSVVTFEAWRARMQSFSDVAALVPKPLTLDGAPPERTKGAEVSPTYFHLLGVRPAIGRVFNAADELNGGAAVAILSDALWRTRYGASREILGRTISVDGSPVTVVGIMPADFDPPRFGWIADQPLWVPFAPTQDNRKFGRFLHVVARIRPGVSIEQARAELAALSSHLAQERPDGKDWSAMAIPLAEQITGDVRKPLIVLFAAVGFLLLMSAVNVASLVLTFARGRQHELAIRRALGASPSRLIRQQFVQSCLLGLFGTAVGLALAYAGTRGLVALLPASVPRVADVGIGASVVVFATLVALTTTIAFSVVGARRAVAPSGARSSIDLSTARSSARVGGSPIIGAEIAIGLVLSVLATLMVRSMANLRRVDLGYDPSVVAGRVFLPSARYDNDARRQAFFDDVLAALRAAPGVTAASLVTSRPLACCAPTTPVSDPAQAATIESAPVTDVRFADASYFATMHIPFVAGTTFDRAESADGPPRAIVSRSLARALWGTGNPIGKAVAMDVFGGTRARVIGVVGDVHLADPRTAVRPTAYLSTRRFPSSERDIVVRGSGDAAAMLNTLRAAVASVDATLPLSSATSLGASVGETLAQDRVTTVLLGAFAGLALVLAAIGVYGVLAGDVSRRRKEIGIRLALGAHPMRVIALILGRALRPAAVGTTIGLVVALALTRMMSALVFGVGTRDPMSFGVVTLVLLAVAAVATLIPAVRATRVSPVEVTRVD
jgi:predicted permease